MKHQRAFATSFVLSLSLVAGCAPADDVAAGDAPDQAAQPISGGSAASPEQSGHVRVDFRYAAGNRAFCSGTLITNEWVLTDKRCLLSDGGVAPPPPGVIVLNATPRPAQQVEGSLLGGVTVTDPANVTVSMGSQASVADAIVRHPTLDLAMIRLRSPLAMNGSTSGYVRYFYFDFVPPATLPVQCFGYGTGAAGTLSTGSFTATNSGSPLRNISSGSNTSQQGVVTGQPLGIASGDAGGACLNGDTLYGVLHDCSWRLTVAGYRTTSCRITELGAFVYWLYQTAGAFFPTPPHDARASATEVPLLPYTSTVAGSTQGSTHDAPASTCGCTSGGEVWHRFTLGQREEVYLDTAGSRFDTSLQIVRGDGTPLAGACNDDAYCSGGAFTSAYQSEVRTVLDAGTWYVAVGGCGTGAYLLNVRHRPVTSSLAGTCRAPL